MAILRNISSGLLAGKLGRARNKGAPTVLTPADISGLTLWLDASDITTLWTDTGGTTQVSSNGDNVSRWDDKSASGWNVIKYSTRPVPTYTAVGEGGHPAINFSAADMILSDQSISKTFTQITAIMVFDSDATGADGVVPFNFYAPPAAEYDDTDGIQMLSRDAATSANKYGPYYNTADPSFFSTTAATGQAVIEVYFDFGETNVNGVYFDGTLETNGTAMTATTSMSPTAIDIGGLFRADTVGVNGTIREVIIYDKLLTASERAIIMNHTSKWSA